MNTATATMRMRTILQNGAAIAIAAAALAISTANARTAPPIEAKMWEPVTFESTTHTITQLNR